MEECPICISKTKSIISCFYCNKNACKKCIIQYFNDQCDVCCMYCKKEWSRKMVRENIGVTYLSNTYKNFKEKKAHDYEKSLLPATLTVIAERKSIAKKKAELDRAIEDQKCNRATYGTLGYRVEQLTQKLYSKTTIEKKKHKVNLNTINKILKFGKCEMKELINTKKEKYLKLFLKTKRNEKKKLIFEHTKYLKELNEKVGLELELAKKEKTDYRPIYYDLDHKLSERIWNLRIEYNNGGDVVVNDRKTVFIRACPDGDCRGYLSSQWKCGICNKVVCSKCNLVKIDESHECKEDDIETAKLLRENTKPCPKCSTGIFKIDGCDQMWCTQCHTAFSWKSGHIQTRVHNPHYYEWIRQNDNVNNVPADGNVYVCGQALDNTLYRRIARVCRFLKEITSVELYGTLHKEKLDELRKNIYNIDITLGCYIQSIIHIQEVLVPKYRTDDVNNNLELRIRYLSKEIDENTFKNRIQRSNKLHEKKKEIYDVFILVITAATEIILRIYDKLPPPSVLHEIDINDQNKPKQCLYNYDDGIHLIIKKSKLDINLSTLTCECLLISEEVPELIKYANKCLEDISYSFNNSLYKLNLTVNEIKYEYTNVMRHCRHLLNTDNIFTIVK